VKADALRDAVVVGIDTYPVDPLKGCVQDAKDIAECLSLDQYGFDVVPLTDREATRRRILEQLNQFTAKEEGTEKRDTLLFYFSGHGQVLGSSGNLVTIDAEQFDPGIALAQLAQIMESASLAYSHVVAIIDCCHSGAAFSWVGARPIRMDDIDRELPAVNESRCILAACRPEQEAQEQEDEDGVFHGAFTTNLLDGLLGRAVNFQGNVTLLGLYDYISQISSNEQQTPVFKGDITGTVVLGRGFDPRKGPPIDNVETSTVLSKGQALVDEYDNLQQRELLTDRSRRLRSGARRCSLALERTILWFEDTQRVLPDIVRESHWKRLNRQVEVFRRNLADLSEGQLMPLGRVDRCLGHGGFGWVWEVSTDAGGKLALKTFHGDQLDDEIKVQRFRNGYLNMRALEHPHIVRVHELLQAPYSFSMDYIPGENLRNAYIDRDDPELCIRLLLDIVETVQHAHSRGVRHRDIKPENIIVVLNDHGQSIPYLTDFDLAYHETNRTVTGTLGIGGVINYAAPEQLFEPTSSAARADTVDVYAIGQLAYFVLTGTDPSPSDPQKNLRSLTRTVTDWMDERAADEIVDFYERATARIPHDRLQSMAEIIHFLSKAESFVLASSGTDQIEEDRFCGRVAHLFVGLNNYEHRGREARMQSLSGQLEVVVRLDSVYGADRLTGRVEVEFTTAQQVTVPAFKSGVAARNTLNSRLDKVIGRYPRTFRHPGTKGAFQTFVEMKAVTLDILGAARVVEVISASTAAIEQW
jgi:hypothetical protein